MNNLTKISFCVNSVFLQVQFQYRTVYVIEQFAIINKMVLFVAEVIFSNVLPLVHFLVAIETFDYEVHCLSDETWSRSLITLFCCTYCWLWKNFETFPWSVLNALVYFEKHDPAPNRKRWSDQCTVL